jgi:hypothetical protein
MWNLALLKHVSINLISFMGIPNSVRILYSASLLTKCKALFDVENVKKRVQIDETISNRICNNFQCNI